MTRSTAPAARKTASTPPPAPVLGPKYFQGNPCRHGHNGVRYVSTKGCVECARAHSLRTKAKQKAAAPQPTPAARPTTAAAA